MSHFDLEFDKTTYPTILLNNGWRSLGKMTYALSDCRILFDTSSKFQVMKSDEIVGSYYAESTEAFVAILDKLKIL